MSKMGAKADVTSVSFGGDYLKKGLIKLINLLIRETVFPEQMGRLPQGGGLMVPTTKLVTKPPGPEVWAQTGNQKTTVVTAEGF